jgi:hypothetical protein
MIPRYVATKKTGYLRKLRRHGHPSRLIPRHPRAMDTWKNLAPIQSIELVKNGRRACQRPTKLGRPCAKTPLQPSWRAPHGNQRTGAVEQMGNLVAWDLVLRTISAVSAPRRPIKQRQLASARKLLRSTTWYLGVLRGRGSLEPCHMQALAPHGSRDLARTRIHATWHQGI